MQEAWCKKGPPSATLHVSLPPSRAAPPAPDPAAVALLRRRAEELGVKIQYSHQGFLQNKRQQLMAGFAIIEASQFLADLVCVLMYSPYVCSRTGVQTLEPFRF